MQGLADVPEEIFKKIGLNLDNESLLNLSKCSKRCSQLCNYVVKLGLEKVKFTVGYREELTGRQPYAELRICGRSYNKTPPMLFETASPKRVDHSRRFDRRANRTVTVSLIDFNTVFNVAITHLMELLHKYRVTLVDMDLYSVIDNLSSTLSALPNKVTCEEVRLNAMNIETINLFTEYIKAERQYHLQKMYGESEKPITVNENLASCRAMVLLKQIRVDSDIFKCRTRFLGVSAISDVTLPAIQQVVEACLDGKLDDDFIFLLDKVIFTIDEVVNFIENWTRKLGPCPHDYTGMTALFRSSKNPKVLRQLVFIPDHVENGYFYIRFARYMFELQNDTYLP